MCLADHAAAPQNQKGIAVLYISHVMISPPLAQFSTSNNEYSTGTTSFFLKAIPPFSATLKSIAGARKMRRNASYLCCFSMWTKSVLLRTASVIGTRFCLAVKCFNLSATDQNATWCTAHKTNLLVHVENVHFVGFTERFVLKYTYIVEHRCLTLCH